MINLKISYHQALNNDSDYEDKGIMVLYILQNKCLHPNHVLLYFLFLKM